MLDIGTKASDDIVASPEGDIIILKAGDDTVDSGDGDDLIIAGKGDDSVDAGAGNDLLILGQGDDTANGGSGSDTILGGSGDDVFIFNATSLEEGSDFIDGGKDYDTLRIIYTDATADELASDFQRLQAYLDAGDFTKSFHFEAVDLEIRNVEDVELIDDTPVDPAVLTINGANPFNVGTVFAGSASAVKLTVTNTGGTTATEIEVSFSDTTNFGIYQFEDQVYSLSETLNPGELDTFRPYFQTPGVSIADEIGVYECAMEISYFDGLEYQVLEKELIAQAI